MQIGNMKIPIYKKDRIIEQAVLFKGLMQASCWCTNCSVQSHNKPHVRRSEYKFNTASIFADE
jgi:hypothetical protein